ncbi:hypothetical protein NE236_37620 [Actinoallomurus purpureus]|uniref:hypothetical protein n=1 Tax=Actinoallomurus purpureus TaxID=478114 RepID=UPI002092F290|nr:hypothetical protein [Actinoallomurus purpureus]MCO6010693.1 hypothetical protein [Actinoallomurus purpureus]
MNRDEVDRALGRLRDERDRITSGLLELEAQQGYKLLKGAPLTGVTADRWNELGEGMASLWRLFEAYGRVLGRAEEIRARRKKPDDAELAELARLLRGPSIELPTQIPLEKRTLLGPSAEHLSLDDVVTRMTALYEEAARMIAEVETAWSALLTRLDRAAEAARAVEGMLDSLGSEPEYDRVMGELDGLRETVRTDPLSIRPAAFDGVDAALGALRPRLEEAVRVRAEYDVRLRRIENTIGLVRAAEDEARLVREQVLAKIASPVLPDLPESSAALADRLAAMGTVRGRWTDAAERVARLEEAAAGALEQARTTVRTIAGLLERRDELRGRLDAYRAKAGRLGGAEDPELTALYQRAHDLLWTSPCDLRRATAALSEYQRAIGDRE